MHLLRFHKWDDDPIRGNANYASFGCKELKLYNSSVRFEHMSCPSAALLSGADISFDVRSKEKCAYVNETELIFGN